METVHDYFCSMIAGKPKKMQNIVKRFLKLEIYKLVLQADFGNKPLLSNHQSSFQQRKEGENSFLSSPS